MTDPKLRYSKFLILTPFLEKPQLKSKIQNFRRPHFYSNFQKASNGFQISTFHIMRDGLPYLAQTRLCSG